MKLILHTTTFQMRLLLSIYISFLKKGFLVRKIIFVYPAFQIQRFQN